MQENGPYAVKDIDSYTLNIMRERENDAYALAKYAVILDWIRGLGKLDILDVGCGSGEFSRVLAAQGHQVTGIDLNAEYIRLAGARAERLGLRQCSYKLSSIEDYAARSEEKYDLVTATDLIEHLEDDEDAVKNMLALIKPDGHLLITVPAGQWLFGYHDEMLQHYRRYSKKGLSDLLERHVQIEKIQSFGFFLIPVCILFSRILRRGYPLLDAGKKPSLLSRLQSFLLGLETKFRFPVGISLLALARPRIRQQALRGPQAAPNPASLN